MYRIALSTEKNFDSAAQLKRKTLVRNATSAIVEVAQAALLIALCPPLKFSQKVIIDREMHLSGL